MKNFGGREGRERERESERQRWRDSETDRGSERDTLAHSLCIYIYGYIYVISTITRHNVHILCRPDALYLACRELSQKHLCLSQSNHGCRKYTSWTFASSQVYDFYRSTLLSL